MRDLAGHRCRLRAPARREDEREGAVVADLVDCLEGIGEVVVGLAREADDDVRGQGAVRHVLANLGDSVQVALPVVGSAHRLQDAARARLQGQVDVLAERRQLGVGANHVLAHVLGVGTGVADPLDALDCVDPSQELGERDPLVLRQVAPVAVHVLAQQGHLANALRGQRLDLPDQLAGPATDLAPARLRNDAVGARAVAAHRDLDPALELTRALRWQVPGEVLELEVPLGGQRVLGEELGQPVDLPGPERHVDEREPLEDLVLDRLRPAAADPHHPLGILGLQALCLPQVGDEAVVGRLADRAGVEQDQVGCGALRHLLVAQRVEHALHSLGVVLVHLTAERGDVVRRHRQRVATRRPPPTRRRAAESPLEPRLALGEALEPIVGNGFPGRRVGHRMHASWAAPPDRRRTRPSARSSVWCHRGFG